MRSSVVDAVVAVGEVSLDLARELARFEPCGYGNPGVNLLVPGAQLMGMQGMGEGGKHLRLQVADASAHCGAVAWGRGGECRVAAHRCASRRRLPPRGQRLARRAGAAARAARRSCRGPSGSRSSPHLPRGSAPPGLRRRPVSRCRSRWPSARVAARPRWPRWRAGGRPVVVLVADVERRLATLPDPRRYGARALLVCSRRGDPAVLEQALEGLRRRRRRGRRPPQLRAARSPARALGARARARPAGASRGARRAGRGQRAGADRRDRVRGGVRAGLRRGRRAARRHGRALARGRAGRRRRRSRSCARAPRGPTSRRLPTSSTPRWPRSPRAGWSSSATAACGSSPWPARAISRPRPPTRCYEGRRAHALAWLDALLAGRPAHPAAAA